MADKIKGPIPLHKALAMGKKPVVAKGGKSTAKK
jgi:hypothetical protein